MFKNYFLVAFRQLWRHRVYSSVNLLGLALGLAVSLLILLFVAHEYSYDRFHAQADRIYRVWASFRHGQEVVNTTAMSAGLGPKVQASSPGIVATVRLSKQGGLLQSDADHVFEEDNILLADPAFLTVFGFELRRGDAKTALAEPMNMLLTERSADKYFGTQEVLGKELLFDNKLVFKVVGVIQNPPSNSSLRFDFLASLASLSTVERHQWGPGAEPHLTLNNGRVQLGSLETYFLVNSEAVGQAIPDQIRALMKAEMGEDYEKARKSAGFLEAFTMQRLTDIRLGPGFRGENHQAKLTYLFLSIALLILALALLNYVSLATARATQRAKEVGVRKVNGASRGRLVAQFYLESMLFTTLAFGLALGLGLLLRWAFFQTLGIEVDEAFLLSPWFGAVGAGLWVGTVLLAGSYPALLLSKFAPAEVLKGKLSAQGGGRRVRQAFTVFQFAVSIALVICSGLVQRQLAHLRGVDIGMDKAQVLAVEFGNLKEKYGAYRQEVAQLAGVQQLAYSLAPLFKNNYSIVYAKSPENQQEVSVWVNTVDEAYIPFFGLQWASPPLDMAQVGAKSTLIVNETTAKLMGMPVDKKGVKLKWGGDPEIIGVLQDFKFDDLHDEQKPLALYVAKDTVQNLGSGGTLYLRLSPQAPVGEVLAQVEGITRRYAPQRPFSYYFLDEAFGQYFVAEQRLARMLAAFTFFALLISGLGLFGLATFLAETRVKEIGIRKVLGASVLQIGRLLSADFVKLVALAFALACPVAYYLMHRWLADFIYKTTVPWWLFAGAGLGALAVALLSVGWQSLRAARTNPVDSLRSE
jgi:putative ABC transport system permease protein